MSAREAFLALSVSVLGCTAPAQPQLPEDVASFVERRDICDHFRGEEPYSPERRAEINRNTEKFCRGTDPELGALRAKYQNTRAFAAALERFERDIEPAEQKDKRP
jgi:hypothetical protein